MSNRILLLFAFCGLIASASAQSNFNRFSFTFGGGLGIGRDDVAKFVGNSFTGVVGGGMNFSRRFGVDAEYMYYDLGLRHSVSQSQGLPNASGQMQSVSLDGIVNAPIHVGKWGAYGIFGVGFYQRSVSARSQTLEPGTICQPAWIWWDPICTNGTIRTQQTLSSFSKVAGGFNYGGGVTHPLNHLHHAKLYIEGRYHRAYQSDVKTIVLPITVGLRW
ncbi:MAG TPA: outer membrane beta-barrel protein [Terriglobales bacterium]|nr:outer membrane beta-barrel protein [Terriglobales bacterium]